MIQPLRFLLRAVVITAVLIGAAETYAQCGDPDAGNCCEQHPTPYCNEETCCEIVCQIHPFCCNFYWDSNCEILAQAYCIELCGGCGSAGAGTCCTPNATPHCQDESCCDSVCAVLPHCCETEWDEPCAELALKLCADLPECQPPSCPGEGPCCTAHDSPFCDDETCCETVCAVDPSCCEVEWDDECAALAAENCGEASNCDPADCTYFCGGRAPAGCWCDEACFAFADCCPRACPDCPDLAGCQTEVATCIGNCGEIFVGRTKCGCDPNCDDNFGAGCCDNACWCEPFMDIPDRCAAVVLGDLTGDAVVNMLDLLALLGNWGICAQGQPCLGDLDQSRVVDVSDLLILLGAWG